jgi:hypothetical protein
MERLLSLFSLYDVLGYLLSGAALILGLYWVFAGIPPNPSTAVVLALLGAGYATGQLVAIPAALWESLFWRWRGGQPAQRMLSVGAYGFGPKLRDEIKQKLDTEVGVAELSDDHRFELARAKLRLVGFDGRAELIRALHGLCRNLSTSSFVIGAVALVHLKFAGETQRLAITAGLGLATSLMLAFRTIRFQRRFAEEIWLDYLALGPISSSA